MKKINYLLLFLTLLFFSILNVNAATTYVNNNGIEMTEDEIKRLTELGFSAKEIQSMPLDIFNENKNILAELQSKKTIYVESLYIYKPIDKTKSRYMNSVQMQHDFDANPEDYELVQVINKNISEEQYNKGEYSIVLPYKGTMDVNPDVVGRGMKTLTTTISYISSTKRYRLKNELVWKEAPKNRYEDLFGIAINNSQVAPVSGTHNAFGTYRYYDSCKEEYNSFNENYKDRTWARGDSGYGLTVPLPEDRTVTYAWDFLYSMTPYPCVNGSPTPGEKRGLIQVYEEVLDLSYTMYYDIAKLDGKIIDAYGSYQHALKKISISPQINLSISDKGSIGGIFNLNISAENVYDGMGGTHAQILNPKW